MAVTDTLRCGRVFYDMCGRAFYDTLPVAVGWEVEVAVAVAVAMGLHVSTQPLPPTHRYSHIKRYS